MQAAVVAATHCVVRVVMAMRVMPVVLAVAGSAAWVVRVALVIVLAAHAS